MMGETAREVGKVGDRLETCMEHCQKSAWQPVADLMKFDNEQI